jgi:hypothetical protein
MASKMDFYDKEKRWQTVEKNLRELMADALNVINFDDINDDKNESMGQNSTELLVLKSIEDNIDKLQNKISQIEANGEEKRFLLLNEECIKLLAKLDSMGDLNDDNSGALRNRRKSSYSLLDKLSKKLNQLAIDNLRELLISVKKLNSNDSDLNKLISEIDLFIKDNENASIKVIENYRYLLEEKKTNVSQSYSRN